MLGFGFLPGTETNVMTQGCITEFGGENLFHGCLKKRAVENRGVPLDVELAVRFISFSLCCLFQTILECGSWC